MLTISAVSVMEWTDDCSLQLLDVDRIGSPDQLDPIIRVITVQWNHSYVKNLPTKSLQYIASRWYKMQRRRRRHFWRSELHQASSSPLLARSRSRPPTDGSLLRSPSSWFLPNAPLDTARRCYSCSQPLHVRCCPQAWQQSTPP